VNYLELTQAVFREAGISQTDAVPQTLTNLTGLSLKIKNWVSQAWQDIQVENDGAEFVREWFSTTLNPRFYFDLDQAGLQQVFAGDTLVGDTSGCTLDVTKVIIVNNGIWADGTAQGFIEYENLEGNPVDCETLNVDSTGDPACRFIRWGDYKLDSLTEMGTGYVENLLDVWWESAIITDASDDPAIGETALPFLDYSQFLQRYETNVSPGKPILITETPDNGTRIFFYPPPDRPYRMRGYYFKTTPDLIEDTDEPQGFKSVYHPMIVWRALMYYGMYEQQPQIVEQAKARYAMYKKKLDREGNLPYVMVPRRLY
jgi:hypothetical protein